MAYDPQRNRRRPKPAGDEPAPIEAILDADDVGRGATAPRDEDAPGATKPVVDDPPPDPSVTPQPADPWSDELLFGMSISTIVGIVVSLLVFRWLWMRSRRTGSTGESE